MAYPHPELSQEGRIQVSQTLPDRQFHLIIQGDVRNALAMLPTESVDCVVSSPPYWGLRDYGIPAVVWDGQAGCGHDFSVNHHKPRGGGGPVASTQVGNNKEVLHFTYDSVSCSKCGAWKGQLGLEPTFQLYVKHIVSIFHEVGRVLKGNGSLYLNVGDTYSGSGQGGQTGYGDYKRQKVSGSMERSITVKTGVPAKCLIGIPERIMLGLMDDGWILRNKIIWAKPNHMPSSVKDRFSSGWESILFFVKEGRYWFDLDAVRVPFVFNSHPSGNKARKLPPAHLQTGHRGTSIPWTPKRFEPEELTQGEQSVNKNGHSGYYDKEGKLLINPAGKNPGDVWTIMTQPFPEAHFATFPEALPDRAIKAGCPAEICVKCSRARERIVNVSYVVDRDKPKSTEPKVESDHAMSGMKFGHGFAEHMTVGWTVCSCEPQLYRPGITLDPFAGSGTVALVAKRLQRSSISIEIKPEYVEMLKRRIDFGHATVDSGVEWLEWKATGPTESVPRLNG